MARGRPLSGLQKQRRQAPDNKESASHNIETEQVQAAGRKSASLTQKRRLQGQAFRENSDSKFPHLRQQARGHKRKRLQEAENRLEIQGDTSTKRAQTSLTKDTVQEVVDQNLNGNNYPINCWRETGSWPKEYFEQESSMSYPFARKKSSSSLYRKFAESSTPSSTTPSVQKGREEKSAPYKNPRYVTVLATKGSFMDKDKDGINKESKDLSRTLLESTQDVPDLSLFHDKFFETTCQNIQYRNEARVIRDISLLIVPSAETLTTYGATNLQRLIESLNEGWTNAIPLTKPRPQPDYAVGFRREAFTKEQLDKLQPFVGDIMDNYTSFFMGTYYMYFPFLTCEVKCGAQALDIADRQNAHSMTLAVRGIVELFRVVNREKELDREILAFSVSHDHRSVRIYGHYPVINGKDTTYYRHPIRTFDFTELDGKEKWTAYKFTKNVYNLWMPSHFKRICSAIDQIPPDLDFKVSQDPLQFSEGTALSQELEGHHLSQQLNANSVDISQEDGGQPGFSMQTVTPETSLSQKPEQQFKIPKKRRTGG